MDIGLYIHIPFCKSRCIYCDFYSTTLREEWQIPYVEALEREMTLRAHSQSSEIKTLYIGGGTPSLLIAKVLRHLFSSIRRHFCIADDAEVTIEANPDDVTLQWVEQLMDFPINRVSMGVQSLNDEILRTLHRRHTARQALEAVSLLQDAGLTNLSLDLIYGLPGQSLVQFQSDVRELLALGIPHLSAYALQFEPGTQLYEMREAGTISEADDELSLSCYESLIDLTAQAGMEHYEISNFARMGFRSRHNSSYWTGAPYLGLGAGAHSYDGLRTRSFNCNSVHRYISSMRSGIDCSTSENLNDTELYNERVMLGLRTCEGINLCAIERDFGSQRLQHCREMAAPHIRSGKLRFRPSDNSLCLTRLGLFVSDGIISDLME